MFIISDMILFPAISETIHLYTYPSFSDIFEIEIQFLVTLKSMNFEVPGFLNCHLIYMLNYACGADSYFNFICTGNDILGLFCYGEFRTWCTVDGVKTKVFEAEA